MAVKVVMEEMVVMEEGGNLFVIRTTQAVLTKLSGELEELVGKAEMVELVVMEVMEGISQPLFFQVKLIIISSLFSKTLKQL
ncbi:hypothetical protein [Helicobacter winghamensis]|uniref:hypothetical protein n=1 Tax=Helicobacter winghamensis TaxID=157268 RepID=UPI0018A5616A|nr:hypothetical protein [Helicobacter winghamensis]QOQ98676.1 hypothetical protein A0Z60_03700 [Helicobacter winghamensis]